MYEQTWVNGLFGYGSSLALVLAALVLVMAVGQLMILRVGRRGSDGPLPLHEPHARP